MTEAEWLASRNPTPMLAALPYPGAGHRRMRLFGCAALGRSAPAGADPRCPGALLVNERFADGQAAGRELRAAADLARAAVRSAEAARSAAEAAGAGGAVALAVLRPREWFARAVAAALSEVSGWPAAHAAVEWSATAAPRSGADALHCVFGNPFRPVSAGPWVTPAGVTVAQDIYDRRDFAALPVLADLLEEAGCPEQSVLDHCRQPGEHARGCWVVDLVLGKS
jgi:hypothetical protein